MGAADVFGRTLREINNLCSLCFFLTWGKFNEVKDFPIVENILLNSKIFEIEEFNKFCGEFCILAAILD